MDWIEEFFGISPDGGNGSLELLIAGSVIALMIALLSLRTRWGRSLRKRFSVSSTKYALGTPHGPLRKANSTPLRAARVDMRSNDRGHEPEVPSIEQDHRVPRAHAEPQQADPGVSEDRPFGRADQGALPSMKRRRRRPPTEPESPLPPDHPRD
jgi:hypothetical protein